MEIRQAINLYLTAKAYRDDEFKKKFENSIKNLDECVLFIQAKMFEKIKDNKDKCEAACVVPSDDEVFKLAEQYYLDDDIRIDGTVFNNVRVLSASATTFTEEEKAQMRDEARKKYQDDIIAEMRKKDEERRNRKKADKKPVAPVLVPEIPSLSGDGEKPNSENKPVATQLSLF